MTEDKDKIILVRCVVHTCERLIGVQKNANYGKWSDHYIICVACFMEELSKDSKESDSDGE